MVRYSILLVLTIYLLVCSAEETSACKALAVTQAGPVCGLVIENRLAGFLGVPYAEQPVGKHRFQELRSLKPWKGIFDATKQGPVCPQVDRIWLALQDTSNMNEACIHANIYTPITALPNSTVNKNKTCKKTKNANAVKKPGLPVLVFVHGGSWQSGSGNADLYGPEYFLDRNVVTVTINYRQNVFGFMSLNTTEVPGNQGLFDIIHLLRWLHKNVNAFGGDPDNVTLMGQSAGASSVHYISHSPLSKGLIKRAILSSGAALPSFFTSEPVYSRFVSNLMLKELGIDGSDPHAAFLKLTELPVDTILKAYKVVQDATGVNTFAPVQESPLKGVHTLVGKEEDLLKKGSNDVPMLLGFNTNECELLQNRIEELNFIAALNSNYTLLLPPKLLYTSPADKAKKLGDELKQRYFDGEITFDSYMPLCADVYFLYPVMKLAQTRAKTGAADTFLYRFSYEGEYRTIVKGLNLKPYEGVAHVEDLTYIFRTNSVLNKDPPNATPVDDRMRKAWINTIVNFMTCSRPVCGTNAESWPPVSNKELVYQDIQGPEKFVSTPISQEQQDMINFYDKIYSSRFGVNYTN